MKSVLWVLAVSAGFTASAGAEDWDVRSVDLGGLEARSAALLLSAQESSGLDLGLAAIALPGEPGRSTTWLLADLGGASVDEAVREGGESGPTVVLELYAYVLDGEGALRGTVTRAIELPAGEEMRARWRASGLRILQALELAPGPYSIRALALHRPSGRLGLGKGGFVVPEWGGSEPVVLPPLVREPVGDAVLVRTAEGAEPPFPIRFGGEAFLPSARPTVAEGEPAEVFLIGAGLEDGPTVEVRGSRILQLELGAVETTPLAGRAGLVATRFDPGELPARSVEVTASIGNVSSPPAKWVVRDVTRASAEVEGGGEPATASPRPSPSRRDASVRIADAWSAIVEDLAEDRRSAALARLDTLHEVELRKGTTEQRLRLIESELVGLWDAIGRDAAGLPPLIRLVLEAYEGRHASGDYAGSTHARELASVLTQTLLEKRDEPSSSRLAASVWVAVAGYLHEAGDPLTAESAYARAAEIDVDRPAALLGQGMIAEARGKLKEARDLFERRIDRVPGDREARLRLGVCHRRLGDHRKALRQLDRVVSESAEPDWIRSVALQERAGLLARQDQWRPAAEALAEESTRAGAFRARIQRAAYLDRLGRHREAWQVLEGLESGVDAAVNSPRLRYGAPPISRLREDRREVDRAARAGLDALRSAVEVHRQRLATAKAMSEATSGGDER